MAAGIIRLEGLRFRAFHGVYPEEQENGNDFLVDVELHTDITAASESDQLQDTVDYVHVYELIGRVMKLRRNLLESLAYRMADEILLHLTGIEKVCVTVSKLTPPIGGACARTSVSVWRERA